MFRVALVLSIVVAGCGRLSFDAAPTGDGGDAPDGTAEPCTFDLCDGFEAPAIDTSVWFVDPLVTRDTSVAHRGSASVRMHINALTAGQGVTTALTETRTLAGPAVDIWVRAWFRLSALPAAMNEMEVLAMEQTSSPFDGNYVFVLSDQVGIYSYDGLYAGTQLALPLDTWFCVLWRVRRSTTNGGIIEVEGDLFDQLSMMNGQTEGVPPLGALRVGISFADANVVAPQPPLDVWVDDVIIHSTPVTCAD